MKRNITSFYKTLLLTFAMLATAATSRATLYTAVATGQFTDPNTWMGGNVPPPVMNGDELVIQGVSVILDTNITITGAGSRLEIVAGGSITPSGLTQNYIALDGCDMMGDGSIDVDSIFLKFTGNQYGFNGSVLADKVACASLVSSQNSSITARMLLHLTGTLDIGPGNLTVDNSALIQMDGGTLPKSSSFQVNLVQAYDVKYTGPSDTTSLELLGIGLRDVEVAANNGSIIDLTNDLNIVFNLKMTSGTLGLNGHALRFMSGSDMAAGGNGTITGTATSDIIVNTANGLSGTLGFAAGALLDSFMINATAASGTVNTAGEVEVNKMILTAGMVNLNGGKLSISPAGSLTGGNSNNYFIATGGGTLTQTVGTSGDKFFPVGTATYYSPAKIYGNSGNTAGPVNVSVMEGLFALVSTGTDLAATEPIVNKTWMITSGSTATIDVDVELQWTAPQEINSFDRNKCYVASNSGNFWDDMSGTMAGTSVGLFTQRRNDVKSLNAFAVVDESAVVSVGDVAKQKNVIKLYPNPVQDVLHLDYTGEVSIYNMQVQQVLQQAVANGSINVSQLPPGIYQLKAGESIATFNKQ